MSFLHGDVWRPLATEPETTWFEETEWGAVYKTIRSGRKEGEYNYREHPIILPNIAGGGDVRVSSGEDLQAAVLPAVSARWSVPVDETHTMNLRISFRPAGQNKFDQRAEIGEALRVEEYKESDNPVLGYSIPSTIAEEDATLLTSLGPISDRENENLSAINGGITMLRDLHFKQIETVKEGRDPRKLSETRNKTNSSVMGGTYKMDFSR